MNMKTIKEFIALREELCAAGVIGLDVWSDKIHLEREKMAQLPNLQIESFRDNSYPYEISTVVDNIEFFCICTPEQLETYFPQFAGYLVEDVDLNGGEEIA